MTHLRVAVMFVVMQMKIKKTAKKKMTIKTIDAEQASAVHVSDVALGLNMSPFGDDMQEQLKNSLELPSLMSLHPA